MWIIWSFSGLIVWESSIHDNRSKEGFFGQEMWRARGHPSYKMAADIRLYLTILGSLVSLARTEIYHDFQFVEKPEDISTLPGDKIFFSCATNLPSSLEEILWLHNGNPLQKDQNYRFDNGQLTFKISTDPSFYTQQEGTYQCIGGASGSKFRIASSEAELSIARLGEFAPDRPNTIEMFEVRRLFIRFTMTSLSMTSPFSMTSLIHYFVRRSPQSAVRSPQSTVRICIL